MAVFDLYSKRTKRSRGEVHDVYIYDELPAPFRVQIVHIVKDSLGVASADSSGNVLAAYEFIADVLCREYGKFRLLTNDFEGRYRECDKELLNFILRESDIERVLDAIEVSFRYIDRFTRSYSYNYKQDAEMQADSALKELNERFEEHGIGFRFESGEIIRVDSELVHSEVIKPALRLLSNSRYSGAQDEYLKAYEHYRSGNYKEALNECLKSFESLMKSICQSNGWQTKPNATASSLIEICLANELIPSFWQAHFSSLKSLLESGTPTGRNKLSAHGQGTDVKKVPRHIVAYALHMTAAAMVFLETASSIT